MRGWIGINIGIWSTGGITDCDSISCGEVDKVYEATPDQIGYSTPTKTNKPCQDRKQGIRGAGSDADIKTKLNESKLGRSKMIEYILKAYYESSEARVAVDLYHFNNKTHEDKN